MAEYKANEDTIRIGEEPYSTESLTDAARSHVASIKFCDLQIQQLKNEWAIADTARLAYMAALKNEYRKSRD
jgi:hypothetical protein